MTVDVYSKECFTNTAPGFKKLKKTPAAVWNI